LHAFKPVCRLTAEAKGRTRTESPAFLAGSLGGRTIRPSDLESRDIIEESCFGKGVAVGIPLSGLSESIVK